MSGHDHADTGMHTTPSFQVLIMQTGSKAKVTQPPCMGSLKWPTLIIHTSTQITAIALERKVPNSSNFFFRGVISSFVSAIACLQHPHAKDQSVAIPLLFLVLAAEPVENHMAESSPYLNTMQDYE